MVGPPMGNVNLPLPGSAAWTDTRPARSCRLRGKRISANHQAKVGNMRKAAGASGAIAIVILGASILAQQAAPAPVAPIPPSLPDWAYTPPPPAGSTPPPRSEERRVGK